MQPTLRLRARKVFGVQLYKNNARALLSRILSILNSDWLQHARSVRGVYECVLKEYSVILTTSSCDINQNILTKKDYLQNFS